MITCQSSHTYLLSARSALVSVPDPTPTRVGVGSGNETRSALDIHVGKGIDIIDYETGIGNSSREQYIRAGQSVSH